MNDANEAPALPSARSCETRAGALSANWKPGGTEAHQVASCSVFGRRLKVETISTAGSLSAYIGNSCEAAAPRGYTEPSHSR